MASLLEDMAAVALECRETHISWVFLTLAEVYKLKKPVELGFLDFRTLAQRKHACEAEVRLNSRLAPGVYLGVVPIRRSTDGCHRINGEGEIVEWAVHMRRLSDEERADQRLARNALGGTAIDAIAEHLARFHRGAVSDERIAALGSPDAIGHNVEENFQQMADAITDYVAPEEAREIQRWQRGFLAEHRALFEERVRRGHVRDGHGDLRLEHVYLGKGGELTVLDCIEFNDRFRFGDTCADIAFLSMDLAWHGSVRLSERLLAAYAREANDFDLYALVDFYEGYRAFVRGKICHFLVVDAAAPLETRERARSEARRYFMLALSTDRRALLGPAVVAVGGLIASGKSTIANALGSQMSAPVVDADRTRKHMLGVEAVAKVHEAAWHGAYSVEFTEEVYAEVFRRAGVVLASGRPVVIDASFRSAALRDRARQLAREHGVPFRFVECRASAEVCKARLRVREQTRGVSDGRLAIFDDFAARFEPVSELEPGEHVIVDATLPLPDTLATLASRIAVWPAGLDG